MDDTTAAELIALMELWANRAEYWRDAACQFASGERLPYPTAGGSMMLRHTAPADMDWQPGPPQGDPLSRRQRAYWWAQDAAALAAIRGSR